MKKLFYLLLLIIPCSVFAQGVKTTSGYTTVSKPTIDSLTTGSVTNATTMDINFSAFVANYSYIFIEWSITPITNNTSLQMLVSANGSTFDNSTGNYSYNINFGTGTTSTASAAFISLGTVYGGGTGEHSDGTTTITNPNNASNKPLLYGQIAELVATSASNAPGEIIYTAARQAQQITKAIRLYMSSGNITGSYRVFGMKN